MKKHLRTLILATLVCAPAVAAASPTRVVPTMRDGHQVGYKIFAIERGSIYARAGFRAGDLLVEIDGKTVTSPDQLDATVRASAKGAVIKIAIERKGTRSTLSLTV